MSPIKDVRSRFERFQRWTIQTEYPARHQFLSADVVGAFSDYYKKLPAPNDEAAIRHRLRGTWRGDSGWTSRWLAERDHPVVLDAGSGFGTFAMLYAAVGAEVLAVDLRPDRLQAAEQRLAFYQRTTGETLAVRTWAGLAPLAIPSLPSEIGHRLILEHLLDTESFWLRYPVPSTSAAERSFVPGELRSLLWIERYWRGPTWLFSTWFILQGLVRLGYEAEATHLLDRTMELIRRSGFREYFNPHTGQGMGAASFGVSTVVADCAAVMDAFPRKIIGWSMDKRQDTNLVVNALAMAVARRQPEADSTVLHSDHGTQHRSWAFGKRLRDAGLLGSMGTVGDCYDNAMMESFWHTMQLELLDTRTWNTREELANAIFEWIECWYNPHRRHSSLGMLSPAEYERRYHEPADPAG